MAQEIGFENDVTGAQSRAKGSDGRLNVSSRVDSRSYYISRDQEQAYSFAFEHTDSVAGEYSCYIQNTSPSKDLVVSAGSISSDLGVTAKVWFVTGTVAGGTAVTPVNNNKSSANDAAATFLQHGNSTAISGLTEAGLLDYVICPIQGQTPFRLDDRIRLGQNDALVIEIDAVTSGTPLALGVLFGYFE